MLPGSFREDASLLSVAEKAEVRQAGAPAPRIFKRALFFEGRQSAAPGLCVVVPLAKRDENSSEDVLLGEMAARRRPKEDRQYPTHVYANVYPCQWRQIFAYTQLPHVAAAGPLEGVVSHPLL